MSTTADQLTPLLNLISSNVSELLSLTAASGHPLPDLNAPFHPSSELWRTNPEAAKAAMIISSAAYQLAAIVEPPVNCLYQVAAGPTRGAALRVCAESNVTEILREAGPQGLHVNDISKINKINPNKLARCLRLLSTHYIYREVSPNVFSNTRLSSMLDTGKPASEAVAAEPAKKHENSMGVSSVVCHHLDEVFKAAPFLYDVYADPATADSGAITAAPFTRAFGEAAKDGLWPFYERPENDFRLARFGIAMQSVGRQIFPPEAVMSAFEWDKLPKGAVIVDVGGGLGAVSSALAKNLPDKKIVVQDLPKTIEDANKWWSAEMSAALTSGQVTLQAHDFFTPQPQTNVSVFLMKHILHDWGTEYCDKILKHLRDAAKPETKLVLLETITPLACHDPANDESGQEAIPGAKSEEAPNPLLPNWGRVGSMTYDGDMIMAVAFNSQERTLMEFDALLKDAGWKLNRINRHPGGSGLLHMLEAIPN